ncbi:hypothetical protein ACI3L1_19365 [Deinococcus sp. SM5_A1]|uniref:hypothetical protein n=1 Tax=Deinococcus sp. SM5_A1 TaxID=3379094 RepID=UPI00385FB603
MERPFIETPDGQFVSAQHLISLDIQQTGREDQLRHEVQATSVTRDKHLLTCFQGSRSREDAEQYLSHLLEQMGA